MNNEYNQKIINMDEYCRDLENEIIDVIKDSTYPELSKYIEMLPTYDYYSWGISYINEYYKVIGKLDNMEGENIQELKYKIYILYLKENYEKIVFTFDEFITFSRLLNITFSDYNPNKSRKDDKETYISGDDYIDYIVNNISKKFIHSSHPHAYEITEFKLKILHDALALKINELLKTEIEKIDLDDTSLNNILSVDRIKTLKEKTKY